VSNRDLPGRVVSICAALFLLSGCCKPSSLSLTREEPTPTPATSDEPNTSRQVSLSTLEAFHRSGQTFITWPEGSGSPDDVFHVYRATFPITSSTLILADRIAEVPLDSGLFVNEVESGSPYQERFIIRDLGPELPPGIGLHVHTVRDHVLAYYAVVRVHDGVELPLETNMTLHEGVWETPARPRPVMVTTNGLKTLYTHWMDYATWNPEFEGYAYNFWVGVPREGNSRPLPLQMHLHAWGESWQRNWTAGDADGSGTPYNYPMIWVEPDDARNTWWYGFADNVSQGEPPNEESVIVNYTEQRLLYMLDWILSSDSPYLVDPDRIFLYGGSMGGTGALTFGLRHPERFSAILAIVPATDEASSSWGRAGFDMLWGTVDQNLLTNEGIPVHQRLDTQQYLQDHARDDLPYTITFHGREDTIIEWSTQGLPWVDLRNQVRAPGPEMWADSDHYNSFDVFDRDLFANYHPEKADLPRTESYLVFTAASADDDPRGAIPSCRGTAPYAYGFLGNSIEWASSGNPFLGFAGPVETSETYQVALRARTDQCEWPDEDLVDVTLVRRQAFFPTPGTQVRWTNRTTAGDVLQEGVLTVPSSGEVTVSGVHVTTEGTILALTSTGADL